MAHGIAGFGHVTVIVNDLAAARHFYGEVLGLPAAQRPAWRTPGAWYRIGAAQLHIAVDPAYRPAAHPSYRPGPHVALYTPTAQYHATIAALRQAGVHFHIEPHQDAADGQWRAFCQDPAGNTVEITDHDPSA